MQADVQKFIAIIGISVVAVLLLRKPQATAQVLGGAANALTSTISVLQGNDAKQITTTG